MSIRETIIDAAESLNSSGNSTICLELIAESLDNNLIDINDVTEIVQEMVLDNEKHSEQAMEILTNNGVELSLIHI